MYEYRIGIYISVCTINKDLHPDILTCISPYQICLGLTGYYLIFLNLSS